MKKKNVIITTVVFFVTIILIVLANYFDMDNLQLWKGGLIIASLALSVINAIKDGNVLIKKSDIVHIISGFILGASFILFIGMYLNLI